MSESRSVVTTEQRPVVSTWTIAKGVFFGMWLFAISAAVISFVVSALFLGLALSSLGNDSSEQLDDLDDFRGRFDNRLECMAAPDTTRDDCNALFGEP